MTTISSKSTSQSYDIPSPEVEIIIGCDEDDLFQMDDVNYDSATPDDCKDNSNSTQTLPMDIKGRYHTPTNEPPSGLSTSVVINSTDYLRNNIMKMRISSISNQSEQTQPLDSILEDDTDTISMEQDELLAKDSTDNNIDCKYEDYTSMIPNTYQREGSHYSRSAPTFSYLSYVPKLLKSSGKIYSPPLPKYVAIPSTSLQGDEAQNENQADKTNSTSPSFDQEKYSNDEGTGVDFRSDNKEEDTSAPEDKNCNALRCEETATSLNALESSMPHHDSHLHNTSPSQTEALENAMPQTLENAMTAPSQSFLIMNENQWRYYNNIAFSSNLNYYYPVLHYYQQFDNGQQYDNASSSFSSWSRAASSHYKVDSRISARRQQQLLESSTHNPSRLLWEQLHSLDNAYEKIMMNPFIYQLISGNACSIKVTGLSGNSHFKDIQHHFYSPHVVFMRYLHSLNCAYITYRNYDEMIRAVSMYDKTKICGCVIYCRPSFSGELYKDDIKHSKHLYNNRNEVVHFDKRAEAQDIFIPELHGIRNFTTRDKKRKPGTPSFKCSIEQIRKPACAVSQHRYLLKNVIPNILKYTIIPVHYVVVKPWLKLDVVCSQDIGYWSFNSRNKAFLNYLFKTTQSVVIIFCVRKTRAYQGYAIMKSEIIDLCTLSDAELVSVVPYNERPREFKTCENGRQWQHCCKIEWIMMRQRSLYPTGDIPNSWNNDIPIRYSKDCTVIEPNLGQRIMDEFNVIYN